MSFLSSFIKIRLNLTEKKQFKQKWTYGNGQTMMAHPVNPSALLSFGHSRAEKVRCQMVHKNLSSHHTCAATL